VTRLVLIRHAEPLVVKKTPIDRPLSAKGRNDARVLGTRLVDRSLHPIVLASPERRAYETGRLAFPLMEVGICDQLREVK
jgi:phosphohistidine phosphatase SixA